MMRGYNIYYGSERLNRTPITEKELDDIRKTGIVRKRARMAPGVQTFDLKKCRIVEVVVL